MKRKLLTMTGLAAIAAVADITGEYNTWHGYHAGDNATGNRATVQGAAAGSGATYIERSEFIGAAAGAFSHDVADSVGLGYRALRGANSLSHVVAIGSGALAASTNLDSVTWINGQFYASENEDAFWIKPLRTAGAADPAQPGRCPVYYKNGVLREQVGFAIRTDDADRAAWVNADAHVWLSACDGNDAYDGLSPTSAVKTIMGAYNAAYNAATNGILNASNEIVVAVAEGCYAPCVIYSALTNGIAYVATGDRKDTIIDGMMATDGTETLGSPYNRAVVVGVRMACPDVLYSVSMRGFTLTRFNHYYRGDFSVRSQVIYGIKFSKCDFTANDAIVREDSAFASGIFDECDFHGNRLRCRKHFAVDAFFGGNSGWGIYGDDVVLSRCHVWDNDMSICAYLMRFHAYRRREVSHCLLEVDFYNSRVDPHELSHHNTVIAKTIANPYVTGVDEYSYAPGFGSGPSNSNFIVLSKQPDTYAGQPVYGIGDSCIVSNANLTADFIAADPSCPSVRSDGKPDYGYRNSGFGPTATFEQRLGAYLVFEDGELCVYTNGVKAGTATFSPHNEE